MARGEEMKDGQDMEGQGEQRRRLQNEESDR